MERVVIFSDHANNESSFRKLGIGIDYLGLRDYLGEGRTIVENFVYVPISPFNPEGKKGFVDFLRRNGFLVRTKIGKPRQGNKYKCNFDVEIAIDVMRFAQQGNVDIIVLACGDGDMRRLCEEVRLCGVRCEIASTDESVAPELLEVASGYINLGAAIQQQRQTDENNPNQQVPLETVEQVNPVV